MNAFLLRLFRTGEQDGSFLCSSYSFLQHWIVLNENSIFLYFKSQFHLFPHKTLSFKAIFLLRTRGTIFHVRPNEGIPVENLVVQDLKPIRSPAQNLGWGGKLCGCWNDSHDTFPSPVHASNLWSLDAIAGNDLTASMATTNHFQHHVSFLWLNCGFEKAQPHGMCI